MSHEPTDSNKAIHWVLVADASRAELYTADLMIAELQPLEEHPHPDGRAHVDALVSGDRGATRASATGAHSRFESHTDPHRATVDAFARELAAALQAGRVAHRFERVVIVAPPTLLGALRSHLDAETTRRVVASVSHDWNALPLAELTERVRAAVAEQSTPAPVSA